MDRLTQRRDDVGAMMSKAVIGAAVVGGLAGFVAGRLCSPSTTFSSDQRSRGHDDGVAATLVRLESKVDRLEEALRSTRRHVDAATARSRAPQTPRIADEARASEPSADPYATWSDDELCLVALSKGDDLSIFKAALRRSLAPERRAKLLVALAAYLHKLEWHCAAEREALSEAVGLAATTTTVGAEAALALAYNYAATPDDRWRSNACFESVLRDAPNEEQRMKGAYGLAWRHDLGDEPKEAAVTAYRQFLSTWGERYAGSAEANWARHRIAAHEARD